MSAHSASPKSSIFRDDDRDMLESLKGLSIKGFQDCAEPNANTPSSTNASLPTPPALKSSLVFLASPERPFSGQAWYTDERSIPTPNAPLLKDADSFTEGTGHGSFDFPLAAGVDENPTLPLFGHPPYEHYEVANISPTMSNSLALDLLPSCGDSNVAVLAWRESISDAPPLPSSSDRPPKKRRRSFNQDEGDPQERRNRRAWSPTINSSLIPYKEAQEVVIMEDSDSWAEPEAPG